MMTKIRMEYAKENDKWYLYLNEVWVGKHYTLEEACKQVLLEEKRGKHNEK